MNYIEKTKDERQNIEFVWRFNTQQALLIINALEEAKANYTDKIKTMYEGIESDTTASIRDITLIDEFQYRKTTVENLLKQISHALYYKPTVLQHSAAG